MEWRKWQLCQCRWASPPGFNKRKRRRQNNAPRRLSCKPGAAGSVVVNVVSIVRICLYVYLFRHFLVQLRVLAISLCGLKSGTNDKSKHGKWSLLISFLQNTTFFWIVVILLIQVSTPHLTIYVTCAGIQDKSYKLTSCNLVWTGSGSRKVRPCVVMGSSRGERGARESGVLDCAWGSVRSVVFEY